MPPTLIKDGKLDREATAGELRRFLKEVLRASGLELEIRVTEAAPGASGVAEVIADLDGRDKGLLLERGGEVLTALEHLAMRALRLEPEWHEKILMDCAGYRALRYEELKMTARVAAERVLATRQPFRLNPMPARERRIVHMALKEMPGVRTESLGVGERRQVVIHPASAAPAKPAR